MKKILTHWIFISIVVIAVIIFIFSIWGNYQRRLIINPSANEKISSAVHISTAIKDYNGMDFLRGKYYNYVNLIPYLYSVSFGDQSSKHKAYVILSLNSKSSINDFNTINKLVKNNNLLVKIIPYSGNMLYAIYGDIIFSSSSSMKNIDDILTKKVDYKLSEVDEYKLSELYYPYELDDLQDSNNISNNNKLLLNSAVLKRVGINNKNILVCEYNGENKYFPLSESNINKCGSEFKHIDFHVVQDSSTPLPI